MKELSCSVLVIMLSESLKRVFTDFYLYGGIFYSYYVLYCKECCYLVGKLNVFGSEKLCVSNTSKL